MGIQEVPIHMCQIGQCLHVEMCDMDSNRYRNSERDYCRLPHKEEMEFQSYEYPRFIISCILEYVVRTSLYISYILCHYSGLYPLIPLYCPLSLDFLTSCIIYDIAVGLIDGKFIQIYLMCFLLFSFFLSLTLSSLQPTPAETRKGGQAVGPSPPLLSVSDPFIPLQVPDAPGR